MVRTQQQDPEGSLDGSADKAYARAGHVVH
jgi:hypothetical protein